MTQPKPNRIDQRCAELGITRPQLVIRCAEIAGVKDAPNHLGKWEGFISSLIGDCSKQYACLGNWDRGNLSVMLDALQCSIGWLLGLERDPRAGHLARVGTIVGGVLAYDIDGQTVGPAGDGAQHAAGLYSVMFQMSETKPAGVLLVQFYSCDKSAAKAGPSSSISEERAKQPPATDYTLEQFAQHWDTTRESVPLYHSHFNVERADIELPHSTRGFAFRIAKLAFAAGRAMDAQERVSTLKRIRKLEATGRQLRADHEAAGKAHAATVAELEQKLKAAQDDAAGHFADVRAARNELDALKAQQPAPIPDALKLTESERLTLARWTPSVEGHRCLINTVESLIAARVLKPMTDADVGVEWDAIPNGYIGTTSLLWNQLNDETRARFTRFANACRVGVGRRVPGKDFTPRSELDTDWVSGGTKVLGSSVFAAPVTPGAKMTDEEYEALIGAADCYGEAYGTPEATAVIKPGRALKDLVNAMLAVRSQPVPQQPVGAGMTQQEAKQLLSLVDEHTAASAVERLDVVRRLGDAVNAMLTDRVHNTIQISSLDQGSSLKPNPKTVEPHGSSLVEKVEGTHSNPQGRPAANVAIPQSTSGSAMRRGNLVQGDSTVPQKPFGAELTADERNRVRALGSAWIHSTVDEADVRFGDLCAYIASLRAPLVSEVERLRKRIELTDAQLTEERNRLEVWSIFAMQHGASEDCADDNELQAALHKLLATPAEPTEEEFAEFHGVYAEQWPEGEAKAWARLTEAEKARYRVFIRAARAGVRVRLRELSANQACDAILAAIIPGTSGLAVSPGIAVLGGVQIDAKQAADAILAAAQRLEGA
jgi:hypothetical protein